MGQQPKTERNEEIKRRAENGKTTTALAAEYGVAQARIHQITGITDFTKERKRKYAESLVCPKCGGPKAVVSSICRECKKIQVAEKHLSSRCARCGNPPNKEGCSNSRRIVNGLCNSCRTGWYRVGRKKFNGDREAYMAAQPKRMGKNKK